MPLNLAAQIPTLVGSTLSCIATLVVLIIIVTQWSNRHHLRHVLIANLLFSEFVNSLNNTVSGIYILASGAIPTKPTPACVANGFIGQLTVQATDFSVLAMAISTLVIVTQATVIADSSTRTKVIAVVAIWVFPVISSCVVASLHAFGPVSGNWCWIVPQRNDLRYGLTHGIRFAIIVATVIIYAVVYYIVKDKMSSTLASSRNIYGTRSGHVATIQGGEDLPVEKDIEMANLINKQTMVTVSVDTPKTAGELEPSPVSEGSSSVKASAARPKGVNGATSTDRRLKAQNKQNVARIMLMRAYPFSYVILWIPGIANRLVELSGHPSQVLVILQASTQLVGFVDSILYLVQWRMYRKD
ncbi:hypothetical protein ANO11243_035070 [Dothideomycetidae sp. 11243]|nr:hypothetical protein ANO11243_035070 [fungal sp. No.11243]